jgi:hypothetical protein
MSPVDVLDRSAQLSRTLVEEADPGQTQSLP